MWDRIIGSKGGSTAITAILINGKKLIVGNVGDSRAIICREDLVEQITVDHEDWLRAEGDDLCPKFQVF